MLVRGMMNTQRRMIFPCQGGVEHSTEDDFCLSGGVLNTRRRMIFPCRRVNYHRRETGFHHEIQEWGTNVGRSRRDRRKTSFCAIFGKLILDLSNTVY